MLTFPYQEQRFSLSSPFHGHEQARELTTRANVLPDVQAQLKGEFKQAAAPLVRIRAIQNRISHV